jgi:hypothetical protein
VPALGLALVPALGLALVPVLGLVLAPALALALVPALVQALVLVSAQALALPLALTSALAQALVSAQALALPLALAPALGSSWMKERTPARHSLPHCSASSRPGLGSGLLTSLYRSSLANRHPGNLPNLLLRPHHRHHRLGRRMLLRSPRWKVDCR